MLKTLSGQTHQVITGVCITTANRQKTFHVISDVRFSKFNDAEIDYYLENYPGIIVEKGSVDEVISMLVKGELL